MQIVILIALSVFIGVVVLISFVLCGILFLNIFTNRKDPPFVPVSKDILADIIKSLKIKSGDTVYDIGCGDARVLLACCKKHPDANYIGIEKNIYPYLVSLSRVWISGKSNSIRIKKRDFFFEDVSQAAGIFAYLYQHTMDDLLPKFEKELSKGTRLVSCDFAFTNKEPGEVVELNRLSKSLCKKLYIYEF
ncbi:hypothetical protein A3I34_01750 [Candidatus Jorgensenbacteria bacterium RIFCSPLOWO2_02_FULL_45_12]|uniref:Methyltransferase domain-containing protein n=2 Tax=Candidatus Joergenseniibacteriota TaxID=1752739 RepID=A0A1F6BNN4_9BACT|nr:MAG: putative rRNA methylase family protein [Candidatus Jorgensenbacteria bacterium GW2011_GWA2_45_9]OGG38488.1 MAG: hypothetical protein A3D55_02155 [Candidatus Jorgensenbacteria bacterium RIFCSPHIGHO2_02_FULL_45_20]OGG42320.1 MAG: hypothetical protein A3I34_01750 [Candidatus Jorgensenbacteria bacterium RIFCSPLOWO2_02_FULL_45_12]